MQAKPTRQQAFEGIVVSTAMQQTCVVLVERWKQNEKYGKAYRVRRRYQVHDPDGEATLGSRVRFVSCRPISKQKRWRLVGKL